jgi:hypothetical protein
VLFERIFPEVPMFLFMLLACGNKELPAPSYVLPLAAIPLVEADEKGELVLALEPIEFARARSELALKEALGRFEIGDQFVDVEVVTGITDAPNGGVDGWRTCRNLDAWLLGLPDHTSSVLFSNRLLPCASDPDGYVVGFVMAGSEGIGQDVPARMGSRGERIELSVTDARIVRVEWLQMFNDPLLP